VNTEREGAYRDRVLDKLAELREYLDAKSLNPDGSPTDWHDHLNHIKGILRERQQQR
jgi:hypothetical protein